MHYKADMVFVKGLRAISLKCKHQVSQPPYLLSVGMDPNYNHRLALNTQVCFPFCFFLWVKAINLHRWPHQLPGKFTINYERMQSRQWCQILSHKDKLVTFILRTSIEWTVYAGLFKRVGFLSVVSHQWTAESALPSGLMLTQ